MLSAPTCSGVSYITTVSAMFYPARAEIEFCPRLKFLQWGRAREQPPQPPLPCWDPSTLNLPTEMRRYLVPEGTWPFRFPVRSLKAITGLSKRGSKFVQPLPDVQLLPMAPFPAHIWAGNAEHPSETCVGRICDLILACCSFLGSPSIHTCLKLCLKDTGSGIICLGIRPSSISQATWSPAICISGASREGSQSFLLTAHHCQRR